MRFGVCTGKYETRKIFLAKLELRQGKAPAKELVTQPKAIGIDNIGLAVVCDLPDLSLNVVTLDFAAVDLLRLAWQSHYSAKLVQCNFSLRCKRRQDIAKVNCIVGVSVEIRPRR